MIMTENYPIKIWKILKKKDKFFVSFLLILSIVCSFLEFLSISSIVPFLNELVGGLEDNIILKNLDFLFENKNLEDKNKFRILILLIIFVFLLKNLLFVLNTYFSNYFAFQLRYRLVNNLYSKYLRKNYQFFLNKNSNELMRNRETTSAVGYATLIYLQIINNIFLALALIFTFFLFVGFDTLYILILFIIFLITYYFLFKNKIKNLSIKEQKNAFYEIKSFQQTFKGIKEILTSRNTSKFLESYDKVTKKEKYMNITLSTIPEISRYFIEFLTVAVLCSGVFFLSYNNDLSNFVGALSIIVVISLRLFPIFNKILQLFQKLNVIFGKLNIYFNEHISNNGSKDEKNKTLIKKFNKIELKNINFKYKKKLEKNIINNFNLVIKKNQILGISGKSGKGKTTLVDIFLGLLNIDKGKILIDGKKRENYILQCNYISQFDYLFDDTILNNISILSSRKKVDQNKIWKLLSVVGLDKHIRQLPEKLNTKVGEYGKNFSGGQIQKISLIRSMYEDSNLVVFDEPTNMLDKKSAFEVFKKIINLLKNKKTILIISHDKSILKFCDKVISL